jgi:hypothetical protein
MSEARGCRQDKTNTMKPNHFNSIFRRLFQRFIVFLNRKPVLLAEDLEHHKQAGWERELFGNGLEKACVICPFGRPPEYVVAALVAGNAGDPSMLDELVKQGYVVGTIEAAGEIFHKLKNRHLGSESKRLSLAGNAAEETILANAADGGSPFAILQPDRFLVPFGEYPHKQGLQLFDRTAAEGIVAAHNSTISKIVRHFGGGTYPVYVGHPDLPGSKDADKRAYGWIENLSVAENGLHLSVKWSDAGRELVENAHFKFYSPLWWTKKVKGGIRPVALKSMGLTNDPNIPVPALANEAEEEDPTDLTDQSDPTDLSHDEKEPIENMKPILAALGLEDGAAPEAVVAKITELQTAANEAAGKVTEAEGKAETMEAEKLKAEEAKTVAENEIQTLNSQLSTLNSSLQLAANHAVEGAVSAGRITPAEAPAKVTEILAANDLATALEELHKLPVKMKVASATGDLGQSKTRLVVAANDESKAAREERATLVANEYERTNPSLSETERKRIAWERARTKNPEAFSKQSPGAAA